MRKLKPFGFLARSRGIAQGAGRRRLPTGAQVFNLPHKKSETFKMTLREGRAVWDLNGMNSEDWNDATRK
jgi:hypothetical protein